MELLRIVSSYAWINETMYECACKSMNLQILLLVYWHDCTDNKKELGVPFYFVALFALHLDMFIVSFVSPFFLLLPLSLPLSSFRTPMRPSNHLHGYTYLLSRHDAKRNRYRPESAKVKHLPNDKIVHLD